MSLPTALELLTWAGMPTDDEALSLQADAHIKAVAHTVWSYTRGNGFSAPGGQLAIDVNPVIVTPAPELRTVIISAAARALSNPTQARRIEVGSYSELPGSLASFSLLETLTLNNFRRRSA